MMPPIKFAPLHELSPTTRPIKLNLTTRPIVRELNFHYSNLIPIKLHLCKPDPTTYPIKLGLTKQTSFNYLSIKILKSLHMNSIPLQFILLTCIHELRHTSMAVHYRINCMFILLYVYLKLNSCIYVLSCPVETLPYNGHVSVRVSIYYNYFWSVYYYLPLYIRIKLLILQLTWVKRREIGETQTSRSPS